jgi:hypothetical protein
LFVVLTSALLDGSVDKGAAESKQLRSQIGNETYSVYPHTYEFPPDLPSPMTVGGREYVISVDQDGEYAICDVTVENRDKDPATEHPYFKGMQLEVDGEDFPTLAATGLHSEQELSNTLEITDRSVDDITEAGKPEGISYAGFLAEDEDIIGVLRSDNHLVGNMGLTHPELARPLYHVWNLLLLDYDLGRVSRFWGKTLLYNDRETTIEAEGSRGFQESLFDDEIRGASQLYLKRDLDEGEQRFLDEHYSHLSDTEMGALTEALTIIHTGEMVPYLIMRYGFYEGHTAYRAEPIAIAFIFGLKSLEEIDSDFNGKLFELLTQHHNESTR